jgi:PKD repeat protein
MMRFTFSMVLSVCVAVWWCGSVAAQSFTAYWPKYNAYTEEFSPEFRWNTVPAATGYVWRIADNAAMLNPADEVATVSLITTPSSPLSYGVWYWQVEAQTPEGLIYTPIYTLTIFSPTELNELSLWLKADAGLTLDANGRVEMWQDLSPSGLEFMQVTASKRPWPNGLALNGFPSLQFSGGQVLDGGNVLNIGTNSRAMFLVGRMTGSNQCFFAKSIAANQPNRYGLLRDGVLNSFLYHDASARTINSSNVTNSFALYNLNVNRSSAQNIFLLNNASLGFIANVSAHNLISSFRFVLGAYNNSTDLGEILFLNGNITEIIFVDSHNPLHVSSVNSYLRYKYSPPLNLGADKLEYSLCEFNISADPRFTSFNWSTGATTESITVNQPGTYWVQVTDIFGFTSSDTIVVNYPEIDTPAFPYYCPDGSLTWNTNLGPHYTYAWSTGETTEAIEISTPGTYFVTVTDTNGCSKTFPSLTIDEDPFASTVSLGPDVDLCNGNTLSLVSGAADAVSYVWNDGSTEESLVVTTSGTYTVAVENANGCPAYDEVNVTIVGDAPVVQIGMESQYCQGEVFTYSDQSITTDGSTIISWNWQFGDAGTSASETGAYSYAAHGPVTVTLTVETDAGCANSLIVPVNVFEKPVISFTTTGQCQDAPVQFAAGQTSQPMMDTWSWNFGDPASGGANTTSGANVSHTFASAGDFDVTLEAQDLNGCRDTVVQTVSIRPAPQVAFSFTEVCQGQTVNFVNQTTMEGPAVINSVSWNLGGTTSTQLNPSRLYANPGFYTITLTMGANNGCFGQLSQPMQVHALPIPDYTVGPACAGLPVTFTDASTVSDGTVGNVYWQFGATSPLLGNEVERIFPNSGTVQLTQTVQSVFGCQASAVSQLTVNPGIDAVFALQQDIVLAGNESTFTIDEVPGAVYTWSIDGVVLGNGGTFTLTPDEAAIGDTLFLTLTVENEFGCSTSSTQSFPIYEARTDLAVTQVFVQNQSGFQVIGAELTNKGSTTLTRIDLFVRSSNAPVFKETWEGELRAGEQVVYVFQSQPAADVNQDNAAEHYLCVEGRIVLPAGSPDEDLTNNELCRNLGEAGIVLLAPYPNPATSKLTVRVIFPEAAEAELWIADASGRIVARVVEGDMLPQGLSTFTLDISLWAGGTYTIVLKSGDEVRKVMVVKG